LKNSGKKLRVIEKKKGLKTGTLLESGFITAISAGTAGSVAAVVTTPIDVVKTRIMLAASESTSQQSQSANQEKSMEKSLKGKNGSLVDAMGHAKQKLSAKKTGLQIGREIVAESGVKGLWRGGALRGVWTMLGSGLYLGVYDSGRIWLGRRRGETIDEDDLM
jgi:solute carrier family 25 S-adenosylmethionine transporter 26